MLSKVFRLGDNSQQSNVQNLADIITGIKDLGAGRLLLYTEVLTLIRFVLVSHASSCTAVLSAVPKLCVAQSLTFAVI